MKKQFLAVGVIGASLLALTAKNSDPVLMNVAGKDVRLSEFEYLFHKNNAQQTEPQSLDQYVGMFVDYKLKVADAESAGIDTTASFISEFTQFRDELSEPYLRDNSVLDSMVNQSYSHMQDELKVSHIMMAADQEATLDSLRQAIIDGKVTFEEVARQYSIDKPSARRGGLMGLIHTLYFFRGTVFLYDSNDQVHFFLRERDRFFFSPPGYTHEKGEHFFWREIFSFKYHHLYKIKLGFINTCKLGIVHPFGHFIHGLGLLLTVLLSLAVQGSTWIRAYPYQASACLLLLCFHRMQKDLASLSSTPSSLLFLYKFP